MDPRRQKAALGALDGIVADSRRASVQELIPGGEQAAEGFLIEIGVKPAPAAAPDPMNDATAIEATAIEYGEDDEDELLRGL